MYGVVKISRTVQVSINPARSIDVEGLMEPLGRQQRWGIFHERPPPSPSIYERLHEMRIRGRAKPLSARYKATLERGS